MTRNQLKAYSEADSIAQEVFSSIRTVFSFNGSQFEQKRYESHLNSARLWGIKKGLVLGLLLGATFALYFIIHGFGFRYAIDLLHEDKTKTVTNVVIIMDLISHGILGRLICEHLCPTRLDVKTLSGINLSIKRGETVALVGKSGCGKSTCIQLLLRFYDQLFGSILIDGYPINDYDLTWLRQNIGVVSQEPVLFGATVFENITYGKAGNVSVKEVEDAAKKTNAHDFIMKLPEQYETFVGERGISLSGGEKQRIVLTRALIGNPKILLLDEATSALDTNSEKIVQEALDNACRGMEMGNHETLMNNRQYYYETVRSQESTNVLEEVEEKEENRIYDSTQELNNGSKVRLAALKNPPSSCLAFI
ncbi:unnamed protein product [Didymodactylos carnosus]|uniref:Uncharacterized protein n=1 Tax=Didymodactylos carnosus TaxID=1234261 RepID=A0A814LL75_9BILA|nr:unnamed protein product [Didymodactylos carnosus]CAF3834909.1 unnamed protein product [Didymodactylos carnosus]